LKNAITFPPLCQVFQRRFCRFRKAFYEKEKPLDFQEKIAAGKEKSAGILAAFRAFLALPDIISAEIAKAVDFFMQGRIPELVLPFKKKIFRIFSLFPSINF
jgi:hypothetical protein